MKGQCGILREELPTLRQHRKIHLPRLQASSNACSVASLASITTCSPDRKSDDEPARLIQVIVVVSMELNCMPIACDGRERCQGWHEQPPRESVVDGADQIQMEAGFQHVAVRARIDCRDDEVVFCVHRQEDNSGSGAIPPELIEGLKAVQPGHGHVQHDHIGADARGQFERLVAVACNRCDVKRGSQNTADRFQERNVIVDEQDARSGWHWDC